MAKKWLKKITPNPKKFTPQFVKKSETLTKLSNLNIAQHIVQTQSAVSKAESLKPKDIRPILREQHELFTTPFSKTSAMILERNRLAADDPERARLTAQINAKTLHRGKLGIAVAGTVVGGVAGTAIAKGGDALTRVNPEPGDGLGQADTLPNYWPDVQAQMYSRYPNGAPAAQLRAPNSGAPKGGIISSIVGALYNGQGEGGLRPTPGGDTRAPGTGHAPDALPAQDSEEIHLSKAQLAALVGHVQGEA